MGRVRGVVGVKIDIISWGWRSEWLILARRGKKWFQKPGIFASCNGKIRRGGKRELPVLTVIYTGTQLHVGLRTHSLLFSSTQMQRSDET